MTSQMAGGTLASVDAETGDLWAVRYDAERGKPVITPSTGQSEPWPRPARARPWP